MRSALFVGVCLAALALLTSASAITASDGTARGPSTTTDPYVLPVAPGVTITSLLTVNDAGRASNGYEFVGVPDGLGLSGGRDALVVFANHELRDTQGIVRRHGQKGAFVSRLVIDPATGEVTAGSDLINPGVRYFDYPSATYVTSGPRYADGAAQSLAFARFCSATLSDPGVFRFGRWGYDGQIFLTNEENGDNSRVVGVLADGTAQLLPRLGLASWENNKPAANESRTTVVIGLEDGPSTGSQLWIYVGTKQDSGDAFERAGLTNGRHFVIDAVNAAVTDDHGWRATYGAGVAADVTLAEIAWNATGATQNANAKAAGLSLNRIEDGHFDPLHRDDFYFVTTAGGDTTTDQPYARDGGGLWRLRFTDVDRPELGATLTLLLDGTESLGTGIPKLNNPDNVAIDRKGNILIQEDPGGNDHIARIVAYRIRDGRLAVVARFDPAMFAPGGARFLTNDEETSGIADASAFFGKGAFLFDAQVHTTAGLPAGTGPNTVQEYVENGQLLLLRVPSWHDVYEDGEDDSDE